MHVNDTLDLPNLQAIIARFHTMYDRAGPNDCWLWKRAQSHNGYGLFTPIRFNQVRAHRFAYVIAKSPIPRVKAHANDRSNNLQIRHRCHNPLCVNPKHLIPGTAQQNFQDKLDANRFKGAGESNYSAKLTREQVIAIRQDTRRAKDIAPDYGVSAATVIRILSKRGWKSVFSPTAPRRHKTGTTGTKNGRAKLTEDQVRAIRRDTRPQEVLASIYGVSAGTIGQTRRRQIWKSVCDL